jgi:RimJ/RimL family protein N-acetyltransferase
MTLFETETIRLRRFRLEDLAFLLELETDEEVMKTTGIGHALTRERIEERLENVLGSDAEPPHVFLAEFVEDSSPAVWMMLRPTDFDGPELGFMMPKRLWGRGIGTDAASATIRYGFERQGLTQIFACTSLTNTASQRVLIKSGMRAHSIVPSEASSKSNAPPTIEQHVFVIDNPQITQR